MRRTSDSIRDYPDEALLEEMQRAAELVAKSVLTKVDFAKLAGIPAEVLARRFGGWHAALERAGLGHMCSGRSENLASFARKYSDEDLLREVRRVAALLEKPVLTRRDFARYSSVVDNTVTERFGCWRDALDLAGVGHMYCDGRALPNHPVYSDESLLEEIRRVAEIADSPALTQAQFARLSKMTPCTPKRRFGSWRNALEQAGVGHLYSSGSGKQLEPFSRSLYTEKQLLEQLRRVAELVGKPLLTRGDFDMHSGMKVETLTNRFGSWPATLERAGLEHMIFVPGARHEGTYPKRHSDEELLTEVRRIAEILGKPVFNYDDFDKHSQISVETVRTRFGTWSAALSLAGLDHMCSGRFCPRYCDEELLEEIRRVAALVGTPLLWKDLFHDCRISEGTFTLRFGSWRAACERAGVAVAVEEKVTTEMLLEEVRRVAEIVGKPVLILKDFDRHSKFASETIRRRFSSWRDVLEHAGIGHAWSGKNQVYRSDDELLAEIRRVAELARRPVLTAEEFKKHSDIGIRTIRRRFGTWRSALERAGLNQ